jgi:hypothetical protein
METTEKIVEAYVRYVCGWATIPNVRCEGQYEVDLLAIDPATLKRYHIETSVSGSAAFSKLTARHFDRASLKDPAMRRTLGFFVKRKFGPQEVVNRLSKLGFTKGRYHKVIVTWKWTPEVEAKAKRAKIQLWDFPTIMKKIADTFRSDKGYFTDDTVRTIQLFVQGYEGANG